MEPLRERIAKYEDEISSLRPEDRVAYVENPLRERIAKYEDEISSLRPEDRVAYVENLPVDCPVEHSGVRSYWERWRAKIKEEVQDQRWAPSVINYPLPDELPLPELDE